MTSDAGQTGEDPRPHLVIPGDVVEHVPYEPTGRDKSLDVSHSKHGADLVAGVDRIRQLQAESTSPLKNELAVFRLTLQEGQTFGNRERQRLLADNGITLNAVKTPSQAVVSAPPPQLSRLKQRLAVYRERNGFSGFQYVKSIEPIEPGEKETESIRRALAEGMEGEALDVQIVLVPRLRRDQYERVVAHVVGRILEEAGQLPRAPFTLSDATPVVRAVLPRAAIDVLAGEEAVFQIQPTRSFSWVDPEPAIGALPELRIDPAVRVAELPPVVVLDSGIRFPTLEYGRLVADAWVAPNVTFPNSIAHGTQVASRVVFGDDVAATLAAPLVVPRARVFDACITDDGGATEDELIERIRQAVTWVDGKAQIFNLSMNGREPFDRDAISLIAYELDVLQHQHGIQFVVSAGNQNVWLGHSNVWDALEDDDTRIAPPAESLLGLTIGSITRGECLDSISGDGFPSVFTRTGPGFARGQKPDLVAPGGDAIIRPGAPSILFPLESGAQTIHPDGTIRVTGGTSFSAPVVAGDLAEVIASMPAELGWIERLLLAKTLLLHTAQEVISTEGLDEADLERVYHAVGAGLSNPQRAAASQQSSVTFLHWGTIRRLEKQRIPFWVPGILAERPGRRTLRVTVTCVSLPPFDRSKRSGPPGRDSLGLAGRVAP